MLILKIPPGKKFVKCRTRLILKLDALKIMAILSHKQHLLKNNLPHKLGWHLLLTWESHPKNYFFKTRSDVLIFSMKYYFNNILKHFSIFYAQLKNLWNSLYDNFMLAMNFPTKYCQTIVSVLKLRFYKNKDNNNNPHQKYTKI